jgi:hypothetical protein
MSTWDNEFKSAVWVEEAVIGTNSYNDKRPFFLKYQKG